MTRPIVLCFSGSDPSGGAGVQADLAAIHNLGGHCAGVITALTVQNTQNALSFWAAPPELVLQQADALVQDMPIHAIKTGMLGSVEIIKALGQWLERHRDIPFILDPVMVASGGGALAQKNAADAIIKYLIPLATIVTPNTIEAKQLAPHANSLDECANTILSYGCKYVLLKGSHEDTPEVHNKLYDKSGLVHTYTWPRLPQEYHGSGCTLASSISTLLAQKLSIHDAVERAQSYTWECLDHAYQPGKGQFIPDRYWKCPNE